MCQMCDEYDAELRRMGIEPDPAGRAHPRKPAETTPPRPLSPDRDPPAKRGPAIIHPATGP